MKVYVLTGCIMEEGNNPEVVGLFSTFEGALKAVRDLKGNEFYEGEYSETIDDDYAECIYKETEDYYGTYLSIDGWEVDKFDPDFPL